MAERGEKKILIIDRDSQMRQELAEELGYLGEIRQADHGQTALAIAKEFEPDIVLLDTDLLAMDGYELCRQFAQSSDDTRVVFIATDASLASREAAYAAGADDFVAKPFQLPYVCYRIERLVKVIEDAAQLKQSLKDATETAMVAISNSGEMGGVIDFMKRSSNCRDIEALLNALVSSCVGHFQLKISALIATDAEQKILNSEGRSSALEAELLQRLKEGVRIYQYGSRMVFNYPRVILQIKDLNWDNEEYIGRIRDHIAIMVEAASHRVDGIVLEQAIAEQNRKVRNSIAKIADVVTQVEAEYKYQQSASRQLFEGLRIQVAGALAGLGLSNAQEEDMLYIIEASSMYADKLYEAGFSLNQKFAGVTAELNELVIVEAEPRSLPPTDLDDSVILF